MHIQITFLQGCVHTLGISPCLPIYPPEMSHSHPITSHQNIWWSTCNLNTEQLILKLYFWSYSCGLCKGLVKSGVSLNLATKGSLSQAGSSGLQMTLLCGRFPDFSLLVSEVRSDFFVLLRVKNPYRLQHRQPPSSPLIIGDTLLNSKIKIRYSYGSFWGYM